ncbi:hypothetical protein TNCV_285401 [Trichonephila clavipes]|nr:hypothetical protein TNCV_285401 [Trichonephila clavipes]
MIRKKYITIKDVSVDRETLSKFRNELYINCTVKNPLQPQASVGQPPENITEQSVYVVHDAVDVKETRRGRMTHLKTCSNAVPTHERTLPGLSPACGCAACYGEVTS